MENNTNINKKVLIAEDKEDYLFILKEAFEKEGILVFGAKNGEDALTLLEKEKPDLFLLDILMPVMDGFQTAQKIKEKGIVVPVIFLTDLKDADSISKALEIIPSDYIVKSDMLPDKIVAEIKKRLNVN